MGIYRTVCHKVEDVFIKMMTHNQNSDEVKQKVVAFRNQKENERQRNKLENSKY
ncbi:hypothetical protein [Ornithinibacillus bavariensis]|uniref:hypothetical protein n=1 Tax=Ornithinibacillus bavariensis TaxID=545502 RepID=UPI003D22D866